MKSYRPKYGYFSKKTKQGKFWYVIVIVVLLLVLVFVSIRFFKSYTEIKEQGAGVSAANEAFEFNNSAHEAETGNNLAEENKIEITKNAVSREEQEVIEEIQPVEEEGSILVPEQAELPSTFKIEVPFVSQAPLGEWDPLHEEACEEASMILVYRFYNNLEINKQVVEDDIQKNVKWQEERSYGVSLEASEAKEILKSYFNLDSYILENPTIDQLKAELVNNNLIIVPCAGRMLDNPYYTGEGPLYHMLVLTGYDRNEFITNDVGTRRGKDYKYKYQVLMDAIHEWNGGDVYNGDKKVIVVSH